MSEAQITRKVNRMMDELFDQWVSTGMSSDQRNARMRQIDEWAALQRYYARHQA